MAKLTPPVGTRKNTLRPFFLLALSVLCSVFVRVSFLQNPKKNLDIYRRPKVIYMKFIKNNSDYTKIITAHK